MQDELVEARRCRGREVRERTDGQLRTTEQRNVTISARSTLQAVEGVSGDRAIRLRDPGAIERTSGYSVVGRAVEGWEPRRHASVSGQRGAMASDTATVVRNWIALACSQHCG
jgi:hypothetical protein